MTAYITKEERGGGGFCGLWLGEQESFQVSFKGIEGGSLTEREGEAVPSDGTGD